MLTITNSKNLYIAKLHGHADYLDTWLERKQKSLLLHQFNSKSEVG